MKLWRVDDVMTRSVASVREDMPYRDVVDLLIGRRISAVPVVTADGEVVGVVSETDLVHKIEAAGEQPRILPSPRRRGHRVKAAARIAAEAMTSPAVTVRPSLSLVAAARRMSDENVKRLPVVDEDGRLVGIVTRSDLLKVHLRTDAQIREDVTAQITSTVPGLARSTVQVTLTGGAVRLSGRVKFRSTAAKLLRLAREVPGVVGVADDLRYDVDDSMLTGSTLGTPFGVA
jgi:CBS domain-containing protein